jgi:hypothetical protein
MRNQNLENKSILSAWVDRDLRARARLEAKASGVKFSTFIERSVTRAVSESSERREQRDALARGECSSCGYSPCMCDQQ